MDKGDKLNYNILCKWWNKMRLSNSLRGGLLNNENSEGLFDRKRIAQ